MTQNRTGFDGKYMKIKYSSDEKIFTINEEGIPFLSFDMLDALGVPNAFTTRYKSWDAVSGSGETGLRVARMRNETYEEAAPAMKENLGRLAKQLGTSLDMYGVTQQQHTANVYVLKEEDLGFGPLHEERQGIDGVVTDVPDAMLVAYGGDCPPVYIVDPVYKAIGLVHAGRKGTFAGIPQVAIETMAREYGSRPEDMYAAVGPGICMDCYEMGDEIYDELAAVWGTDDADRLMKRYPATDADGNEIPGGKYHLDLWTANHMTLLRAGIPEEHIRITNVCTCCNADTLYSYRARRMENEGAGILVNRFAK